MAMVFGESKFLGELLFHPYELHHPHICSGRSLPPSSLPLLSSRTLCRAGVSSNDPLTDKASRQLKLSLRECLQASGRLRNKGAWRRSSAVVASLSPASPGEDSASHPSTELGSKIDLNLPRRRLQLSFTCDACGARSQRLINPDAYARGTVFVQCAGCEVYHKLVDNLGLIEEYDFRQETNNKADEVDLDALK